MADYYTLIARAVSGLPTEARQALYERARAALTATLSGQHPPISELDIERERLTLEASIQKVEEAESSDQDRKSGTGAQLSTQSLSAIEPMQIAQVEQTYPTSQGLLPAEDAPQTEPDRQSTDSGRKGAGSRIAANRIRKFNLALLAFTCSVSIVLVGLIFINGRTWFANHVLYYMAFTASTALVLCGVLMLPLARSRMPAGVYVCVFLVSSHLFGMTTWLLGFLTTLQHWGWVGVWIGLCLGGIGVVPLGVVVSAMHSDWSVLVVIVLGVFVTYGARDLALGSN